MDGAHGDPLMLDHRTDGGLVTLEWLLLVAAVAGLAAASTLAVQRVLDDTADVPADPHVRVIDADIAAALLAEDANAAALAGTPSPDIKAQFEPLCLELALPSAFGDVAASAAWTATPSTVTAPSEPPKLDTPAKCEVRLRPGLGG